MFWRLITSAVLSVATYAAHILFCISPPWQMMNKIANNFFVLLLPTLIGNYSKQIDLDYLDKFRNKNPTYLFQKALSSSSYFL